MARAERGDRFKRLLDRWVGCPLIWVLGALHRKRSRPRQVERIGVLMFGAIGDALLSSAIIHDIRRAFPAAHITAFASSANFGVLELLDGPDATVITPVARPFRAIAGIRRRKLDILIDVGQWPRISALISALAAAKFTVGFKTQGQSRHRAFDAVTEHSAQRHEIDNFRALLGCLGMEGVALPRFREDLFRAAKQSQGRPYVVLHPWASGFRCHLREWPIEKWRSLASIVLDHDYGIVITGGPQDRERAESLAAGIGAGGQAEVLAGRASLRETAVSLLGAAAVVSVNTGIMHIAALLERPTIALHGPTNPRRWGPIGKYCSIIGPGPESGCGYLNLGFEYPTMPPDCMSRISVEEVADCLTRILGWCRQDVQADSSQS